MIKAFKQSSTYVIQIHFNQTIIELYVTFDSITSSSFQPQYSHLANMNRHTKHNTTLMQYTTNKMNVSGSPDMKHITFLSVMTLQEEKNQGKKMSVREREEWNKRLKFVFVLLIQRKQSIYIYKKK